MRSVILIIFIIIIFSTLLYSKEESHKDTILFQVQWFPQSQFAGYIMAYEKGFYKDEGINVKLIFSDGSDSPIDELLKGNIDFCTAWLSQTLTSKAEGRKLVNICQVLQKSSLMLIAKKSSNIFKPEDMNGKRIGLWKGDFTIQPNAFIKKYDIKCETVQQSYNIHGFLANAWDVESAMYFNEYHKVILAGINEDELVTFFFSDYDLNFPEDGIYCTEYTYYSQTELCRRIFQASIKGWEYAFNFTEETLDKIMQYCDEFHMQTNRSHQKWMLNVIESSIKYKTGDSLQDWGKLKKEDYEKVGEILKNQDFIKNIPPFEDFFKEFQYEE